jgi:hypothetical protein
VIVSASGTQGWFIAGTIPLMLASGAHAVGALFDVIRPRYFAPTDDAVRAAMEGTGLRLRRLVGGGNTARPSMWDAWQGFNISHGLGVFAFALLCLLIATQDFTLVERISAIRPITVAFSGAYLALSLRFWFWGPAVVTGLSTVCFTVAAVRSA